MPSKRLGSSSVNPMATASAILATTSGVRLVGRRSSLLPGRRQRSDGERSQVKSPKPYRGVKQPTSYIHSDEKTLVKYLPDIMRFCAFSDASVRNQL